MKEITGDQVNALMRSVKTISDSDDGDQELSLLAIALCVAARSCEIDRAGVLAAVESFYEAVGTLCLVPLPGAQ